MQKLSKDEMKKVMGGTPPGGPIVPCKATANCASGVTVSCSGFTVGNIGGCNATDVNYIQHGGGQVTCTEWVTLPSGGQGFLSQTHNCSPA